MLTNTVFHSHTLSIVFLVIAIILIVMWYWDRRDDEKEKTEIDQADTAEAEAEQTAMVLSGVKFRRKLLIVILVCFLLCICSA